MIYTEFSFPNDSHIIWSLMIVTYPYISGIMAGAFGISALYFVFGIESLKPVSRFSLLVSFSFLLCATLPLLNHLGHPERALNVVIVPNHRSAIGGFGYIYSLFLVILAMIIWFAYREDMIRAAEAASGLKKRILTILLLWNQNLNDDTRQVDRQMVFILTAIGIPSMAVLSGYVGFLFGSLKSNPWWSTPLMPFVFFVSGIISGLALVLLLYLYLGWYGYLEKSYICLRMLCSLLWFSTAMYIVLEGVELLYFYYESSDAWFVISTLLFTKLKYSFFVLQLGIGLGVAFVLLSAMFTLKLEETSFAKMGAVAAVYLLFEVWMMRWNIVVGGQLFSKSYVGFREFHPQWLEKEGILMAIIFTLLPFLVLFAVTRFLSVRPTTEEAPEQITSSGSQAGENI
ncbi:MAG: polysulfide reductase NrfD [Nitrospinota bacterium]|nr:polysulfide reductase NrfD [Nitrospinota bacterium]MDH5678759.1 polysulfide reductase NrfD [Nitrospinota bacterium]MDH5755159.1 polysulfide reductase NrfD [Nitrospinota bacterium]